MMKGMFSAVDDRSTPAVNSRISEYAPARGRGRRASADQEDIITGLKKGQQPPAAAAHGIASIGGSAAAHAPYSSHQQQPPYNNHPHDSHAPPSSNYYPPPSNDPYSQHQNHNQAASSHYNPNPSYPSSSPYDPSYGNNYNNHPPPPPLTDYQKPPSHSPSSPVAKNRAKAMGSTIFNLNQQEGDIPSNTITGHFRGRVGSAAPVQPSRQPSTNNNYGQQQAAAAPPAAYDNPYSSYNNNNAGPNSRTRHSMLPTGYGGDEQKSNNYSQDPYQRQQDQQQYGQPQQPYDSQDSYTQRQGGGGGYGGGYPDPSGYDSVQGTYRAQPYGNQYPPQQQQQQQQQQHSQYPSSPPRSPSFGPRASWGGGDMSMYEAGTLGARDESRRKKEEMRLILDAQIKEKQALGGNIHSLHKGSTKYALRHRERQAELIQEQRGGAAGALRPDSPPPTQYGQQQQQQQPHFNYQQNPPSQYGQPSFHPDQHQHQQQQYGHPPPQQQQQLLSPSTSHGRFRSDLHAGTLEAMDGLSEKMKAQIEFRQQLAEQVREKEQVKQQAKAIKDEEDRKERIRLGLEPIIPIIAGGRGGVYHHNPHQQQQQQQQQQGAAHHPAALSLSPGGGVNAPISPSKVAENRGRQMSSHIFNEHSGGSGGGGTALGMAPPETDAEKKARERAVSQQAFAEQIELRQREKAAAQAKEAELERRDNERIQRERLEMLNRFQGLDPQQAALKAQQAMDAARGGGQGQHGGQLLSPSNAKTLIAPDRGSQHFNDDQGMMMPPADDEAEENIAKLTALTNAMNRKVDARRAAAQHFEDSGTPGGGDGGGANEDGHGTNEHGGGGGGAPSGHRSHEGANLDQYEEVPRRRDGVELAGRRGGKQGPSNNKEKGGKGERGAPDSKSNKGGAKSRGKSASRHRGGGDDRASDRGTDRSGHSHVSSNANNKLPPRKSAAQRDRDRESDVIAAAEKRRQSILARARAEVEGGGGDGEDGGYEEEPSRISRRSSSSTKNKPVRKSGAGGNTRSNSQGRALKGKPRVSSASQSSVSRRYNDNEDDGGLDVEVQHYDDEEEHSSRGSRIPYPRVQSGKKRAPLGGGGEHRHHSNHHEAAGSYISPNRGGGGHHHHDDYHSHPFAPSHVPSQSRSPHRGQQQYQQQQQQQRQVDVNQYPWFSQAAAANTALDSSLSGNSAFILLPSSSSLHGGGASAPNADPSTSSLPSDDPNSAPLPPPEGSIPSSRAGSSLKQYEDVDGISPDELDKLMQHYGQTLGLETVFDTNLVPGTQLTTQLPSRIGSRGGGSRLAVRKDGGGGASSNVTPRSHTPNNGGAGPSDALSPLSPGGGESLEVGSQEWLQGSLLSPEEANNAAERALSPGANVMQPSHSRSSLGGQVRAMPRVVDPFSKLQPDV